MNYLNPILVLVVAFVSVFLEAWVDIFRELLGTQLTLLPALIVYVSLTHSMAIGVVTLLFSHVFINIGMNIRLMPVTGIPLPLLSYGGSSVVCSLIAIGILHNIHIYRKSY